MIPIDPKIERTFRRLKLKFAMGAENDNVLVVKDASVAVVVQMGHARLIRPPTLVGKQNFQHHRQYIALPGHERLV